MTLFLQPQAFRLRLLIINLVHFTEMLLIKALSKSAGSSKQYTFT
jgi:hypothetical protein